MPLQAGFVDQTERDQSSRIAELEAQVRALQQRLRTAEGHAVEHAEGFREFADAMPIMVWTATPEGAVDYANATYTTLTGDDRGGEAWTDQVHPEDVGPCLDAWREALATGRPYAIEFRVRRRADGAYVWYLVRAVPVRDGEGKILKWYGTAIDVHRTRESEERFRLLCRATNDAIWDWNLQTDELWWNEGIETLFGYLRSELSPLSDSWTLRVHPDDHERVVLAVKRAIQDGQLHWSGEYRFLRRDGSYAYVLDRGYVMYDDAGAPFRMIGSLTDLTERKRDEERLREQAELIEKAQDAILVRDLEGRLRYMNARAEAMYGWGRDTAIGQDVRTMHFGQAPEAFARANLATIRQGEWTGEFELVRRDGKPVLVEGRWTLLRRPDDTPYGILAINTDITERKHLEQQFLRAQRLESIGTLAGGIAHDLNNVLTPILCATEMLREGESDAERLSDIDTIELATKRAGDMVAQLLAFARGNEGQRTTLSLTEIARDVERIVRDTFPKDVRFRLCTAHDLWSIKGDPTQLNQVLMNLCLNARDALVSGGALNVSLENAHLDEVFCGMHPDARPGKYVLLRVEDTGTGMSPEVVERAFEPFFTTKEPGKGTGLGLPTTYAIVKRHGGFVQLQSRPGKGTNFSLYFPATGRPAACERPTEEPSRLPRGRGECVLVVDDEEKIRSMMRRTLERFGYRVLLASHGAEAVALYASNPSNIDVVLTDMAMPVMDGVALVVALRAMNAKVHIIGSSGLSQDGKAAAAAEAGLRHFIPKPYTGETILNTLRSVLDSAA